MSDEEILQYFANASDPILTTSEIADMLGFSNEGARKRLYPLVDSGHLDMKRVGNSPAFWITDKGLRNVGADE